MEKRKITIILSVLMLGVIMGCNTSREDKKKVGDIVIQEEGNYMKNEESTINSFVPDVSEEQYNRQGNTNANLKMGGVVAAQGDWVYWLINNCIFKQNAKDNSEVILVHEWESDSSYNLNVCGEWLYCYLYGGTPGIWRVRTDGSSPECLSDFILYESSMESYNLRDYVLYEDCMYLKKYSQISSNKYIGELVQINLETLEEKSIFNMGECGIFDNGLPKMGYEEWNFIGVDSGNIYLSKIELLDEYEQVCNVIYALIDTHDLINVQYVEGGIIPCYIESYTTMRTLARQIVHDNKIYSYCESGVTISNLENGYVESVYVDFLEEGMCLTMQKQNAWVMKAPQINIGPLGEGIVTNLCKVKGSVWSENVYCEENIGVCFFEDDLNLIHHQEEVITEDVADEIYTVGNGYVYYVVERGVKEPREIYRIFHDGTMWEKLPAKSEELAR